MDKRTWAVGSGYYAVGNYRNVIAMMIVFVARIRRCAGGVGA